MTTISTTVNIGKKPAPVTLSDAATAKVAELLAQEEGATGLALRVAVKPGGCSGYSYEMFFDAEVMSDDVVREFGTVRVVVDAASAELLTGLDPRLQRRAAGRRASTSPTPTPPAPAAAAPPSAERLPLAARLLSAPARRRRSRRPGGRPAGLLHPQRRPSRSPTDLAPRRAARGARLPLRQGRLQPPGPVRVLHRVGRRRTPRRLRHAGPPHRRTRGHHARGTARRAARPVGRRLRRHAAAASAASAPRAS